MSTTKEPNGAWKAVALTAVAILQALCLWTLSDIKTDIRNIQSDQRDTHEAVVASKAQLAYIAARHALEDLPKPNTPADREFIERP